MNILPRTQFGNPVLRKKTQPIAVKDVSSERIQTLIGDMRHTLLEKKLGVALAAPQVGESLALVVVAARPMLHRYNVEPLDMVLVNPEITEYIGRRLSLFEGCISSGRGGQADLFAKVPRYPKVRVRFRDEHGKQHHEEFDGLKAHIVQHEIDHLNGILFVDRVKDTKSYMTYKEYVRMMRPVLKKSAQQDEHLL